MRLVSLVLCLGLASWSGPTFAGNASLDAPFGPRPWLDERSYARAPSPDGPGQLAQATEGVPSEPADDEAHVVELEARRNAIDLERPRFWTNAGIALTGVGLAVGVITIVACLGSSEAGAGCSPEHWAGLGTTTALFTLGGVATLVPNAKKLRERTEERRRLDEEIRRLRVQQDEAGRPRIRLGFDPSSRAVSVGWVY